jgi:hypothetical protein
MTTQTTEVHPMAEHHDTVVVKDGSSSTSVIVGIIAVIVILAAGWYFLLGPGAGTTSSPTDVNVDVNLPSVAPDAS